MCLIVPHCSPLMFHWFASSLNAHTSMGETSTAKTHHRLATIMLHYIQAHTYTFSCTHGLAVVMGTVIMCACIIHTFQDSLSHVRPHPQTKQAQRIISESLGVNMDSDTSLRLLLPLTLSETQWSRELHNSLLFTAPSLTYTNINAPFCVSCALVFLSGVAKVITAYCLRSSPQVLNLEECTTLWGDGGRGSY